MSRFFRCRIALLLVLLVPAALQAAEPRRAAEPLRRVPVTMSAWDMLSRVWSFLTGAQSDNGCEFDPSGRCRAAAADNGCGADPNGRCRS